MDDAKQSPKHCDGCRHWTGEAWADKKICQCPNMHIGYPSLEDARDFPPDHVVIEGDEGWGWFTGPDFGCVHFEK